MAAVASAKELMNRGQTMVSAEWAVPNEAGYLCVTMQTSGNSWWGHCGINPSYLIFALMLCNHISDDKGVRLSWSTSYYACCCDIGAKSWTFDILTG